MPYRANSSESWNTWFAYYGNAQLISGEDHKNISKKNL